MSTSFAEKISGRTVLDANGQIVGTVDDLLLDDRSWQVESFRIRLKREVAKEIGASSHLLRAAVVDIPSRMVGAVGDAVILSVAAVALHELVTETTATPPEPQLAGPADDGR